MRYFVLEGQHLEPFENFAHLEPGHHAFMEQGYAEGWFLFSGPQIPAHGGFLVARGDSAEPIEAYFVNDPFVKAGKMRFSRITEFQPAQCQATLNDWFGK